MVESNSDMMRGMAQMQYTASFYAGSAYSVAVWIARRTELNRRVAGKLGHGNVLDLGTISRGQSTDEVRRFGSKPLLIILFVAALASEDRWMNRLPYCGCGTGRATVSTVAGSSRSLI